MSIINSNSKVYLEYETMKEKYYIFQEIEDIDDSTVDLNEEFGKSINGTVGQHPFASMQENPDLQKRLQPRSDVEQRQIEEKKRSVFFQVKCLH